MGELARSPLGTCGSRHRRYCVAGHRAVPKTIGKHRRNVRCEPSSCIRRNQKSAAGFTPPSAGVKKAEDQVASSKVTNSDRQIATMLSEKKKRVARAGGAGVALPAAATGYSAASSPLYKQQAAADPATNMRVPAVSERVAAQAQSARSTRGRQRQASSSPYCTPTRQSLE